MTRQAPIFLATLWLCLALAWLVSGEQFLDLVFAMPDAGPVDDWVIAAAVGLEDFRARFAPPDLFAALRAALHHWTGLN